MRPSAGRLLTILLLCAVVSAGVSLPVAAQADTAEMVMLVSVGSDGDARWTVSARFTLTDANESAAFDRLANEYVTGETDVLSAEPFRAAASLASESTGRAMTITGAARAAGRGNGTGELRLSFTWTNFTRVVDDGERLVLGDVFTTPTNTWLPGLRADQVLVIEFPEGYAVRSSSRALDNGSIRVAGPASFEPGNPSATLERTGPVATSPRTTATPSIGVGVPSALSVGAALAILLVVGYLIYRRQSVDVDEAPEVGRPSADGDEPTDDALLSDEERVLRLLRAEGGRMKQVDIVEETDWSNAKVSQLLTSMAEAGQIEKLRIGRENLISLPGEEDG